MFCGRLYRRSAGFLFVLVSVGTVSASRAAYLSNRPVTVTQPDGTTLNVLASGDEYFNWLHDEAGYVIKRSPKTGWFEYTRQVGDALPEATGYVAGKVSPATTGLKPGIIVPMALVQQRRAAMVIPDTRTEGDPPTPAPTSGTLNNIVIFIRFQGDTSFTTTKTTYNNRFNAAAPANSIRAYFLENSYNKLTVDTGMYPAPSGETILSYQDSHPRAYYEEYDVTTNPIGYQESQRTDREHTLLKNAVEYARNSIPTNLVVDGDNDGSVDNVCFIVKGGTEGWAELLWPHAWALYSYDVRINNKRVWGFNFQLESWIDPGVLCHELGHTLGAPDLYHYNTTTPDYDPVGGWDLMCGTRNPPQHMTARIKSNYLGWITNVPEVTATGTYTLNPITSPTNNCLKIKSPNSTNEFFMVEYRRKTGTFESSVPGSGLIVYRVRNGVNGNAGAPPDEVYVYRQGGSCTAGGGDPSYGYFSGGIGRTSINDATNPSPFLSNCSPGGLDISQVGAAGATISFKVTLPGPQPTAVAFSQQPSGGHTTTPLSPQPRAQLVDANGDVAVSYNSPVTITVASGPGFVTGTTTVNALRGVATFTNVAVTQPGAYTLRASSTGLTPADSLPFTVTAPATQMVWSVQPTGVEAGDPISPAPAVSLRDADGNLDTNATDGVSISIASGPPDATLSGSTYAGPTQGLAVFPNLWLSKPGTYVLRATAANLPASQSEPFVVTQTAVGLDFQRQPSGAQEGLAFSVQPIIRAVDKGGRTVAEYTGEVSIALKPGTGPSGAVLSGARTATFANGYANFQDLSLDRFGTGYVLTATTPSLPPVDSAAFIVSGTPGLRFQQTSADALTVSLVPPGAPVISATVYLQHVPGEVVPATVTPLNGWSINATYTAGDRFVVDLTHDAGQSGPGEVFSANFTGTGAASGRTTPVTLTAESITMDTDWIANNATPVSVAFIPGGHLAFPSPVAGAEPGATLPAVPVAMQDGTGTTVADFTGAIRIALKPGTGEPGALLLGTLMRTATAGEATFGDLSVDRAGTGYVLSASYDTWATSDSAPFAIGAAPLTLADAASALSAYAGVLEVSAAQVARLDVVGDGESAGKVDIQDAVSIARIAAGL